jgi:ADP-ribosyl-[dinitrogen reductase] hydrolase
VFSSKEDAIRGGIFGLAVGDALGGPVEFLSAEEIKKQYGYLTKMVGGGWLDLRPGETTDDTAMMACVARGLIECPLDPVDAIGRYFMAWYQSKPKDIGNATHAALGLRECGVGWDRTGQESEGNGCLMRTLPVSYVYRPTTTIWRAAGKIAGMTHKTRAAKELCGNYNLLISFIIEGVEVKSWMIPGEIHAIDTGSRAMEPTDHCLNTLHNAIWGLVQTTNFEDALTWVVNLGGDADTAGAVAGGLAGTYYGYDAIPKRWLDTLEGKDRLDEIVSALLKVRQEVKALEESD